jgi:ABC-type amino acid transport substrate-binding protein
MVSAMLLLAGLFAAAGCSWFPWKSTGTLSTPPPAKAIRVGMAPNDPPIAFQDDGELAGIEVDLARELARETGITVTIKQMAWAELIPALNSGKIDVIMSGMSMTEARAQQVSFVEPYLRTGQMVLIREQDAGQLGRPATLREAGRRVGVVGGTTGEQYVRTNLTQARVVVFDDSTSAVRALSAGRVDYFIHDAPSIWRFSMPDSADGAGLVGLYTPLTEEFLAWAVRKDDQKLKAQLDAAVLKMKQRGVVDAIVRRWVETQVEVTPIRLY